MSNSIIVTGSRYEKIPRLLQSRIDVSLGVDELRQQLSAISLPWAKVNNHKLTISYRGETLSDQTALESLIPENITNFNQLPPQISAYLVNVVPELKLDGEVVGIGQSMQLGYEMRLRLTTYTPAFGNENFYSPMIAGSYFALASIGGSVSSNKFSDLTLKISKTKAIVETGGFTSLSKDDILGDMFYSGVLGYYAQFDLASKVLGKLSGQFLNLLPSIGTYGYVPAVNYLFSLPVSLSDGGFEMNLNSTSIAVADTDNLKENRKNFIIKIGVAGSALEHAIPEQMFVNENTPGEAISATKALSKAVQAGQRIYQINSTNISMILPKINHSGFVLNDITNAVNTGFEVITHSDAVSIPGWSGAGYVIIDPETGDGVYKIENGTNGTFLKWVYENSWWLGILAAGLTLNPKTEALGIALSLLIAVAAAVEFYKRSNDVGLLVLYLSVLLVYTYLGAKFFKGSTGAVIALSTFSYIWDALMDIVNDFVPILRDTIRDRFPPPNLADE